MSTIRSKEYICGCLQTGATITQEVLQDWVLSNVVQDSSGNICTEGSGQFCGDGYHTAGDFCGSTVHANAVCALSAQTVNQVCTNCVRANDVDANQVLGNFVCASNGLYTGCAIFGTGIIQTMCGVDVSGSCQITTPGNLCGREVQALIVSGANCLSTTGPICGSELIVGNTICGPTVVGNTVCSNACVVSPQFCGFNVNVANGCISTFMSDCSTSMGFNAGGYGGIDGDIGSYTNIFVCGGIIVGGA